MTAAAKPYSAEEIVDIRRRYRDGDPFDPPLVCHRWLATLDALSSSLDALLERLAAVEGALREAIDALDFYASGDRNAFRCASEPIDCEKNTGPCCERVIDAGGIAEQALVAARAALSAAKEGA